MFNLNKQYALLGYNINIAKDIVKNMSDEQIFSLLPTTILEKNTVLHHITKSTDDIKLGEPLIIDEKLIPFQFDLPHSFNKSNVDIISTNDQELKCLDVTQVSLELGFNPLYFYINDKLYQTDENLLYEYCKKKNLDGYINLNQPMTLNETSHCPYFNHHNHLEQICPTIYLINRKKYGVTLLKTRGIIELTNKNRQYLTYQELIKLYNVLFCNIAYLIDIIDNVKTKPVLNNHIITFYSDDQEYSFDKVYKNKEYLDALTVNYTNLKDECDFDCCGQMNEIKNTQPPLLQIDIYSDEPTNTSLSKKLFKEILSIISDKYHINSFLFQNYEDIATLKGYENLNQFISEAQSIEQVGYIINHLEKNIINTLYTNYKASEKTFKTTVNFINLEYLPTTYRYIVTKIMNQLETMKKDDVKKLIQGELKNQKDIVKYFNINDLTIDMFYRLYKKPSHLYQALLNDIAQYKKEPVLDLNYIKMITKLNDDEETQMTIKKVYNNIYDIYKSFIQGQILFEQLYQLLEVNVLYNALFHFTQQYNLNVSLVMNYHALSQLPDMEQYNIDTLKELTLEEYEELLDDLKMHVIKTKLLQRLSQYFNLNKDKDNVKTFLNTNINRIINNYRDNKTSDLSLFLENPETDFYQFMTTDVPIDTIVQDIIHYNTNDVMLDVIYNQLKTPLINKNKILKLTKNKNLFDIDLSYLRNEMTRGDLEKAVFINLNKEENREENKKEKVEERTKKSTKRKKSSEEETEEM